MSVRAKFRLNSYTTEMHMRCLNPTAPRDEARRYEDVEKRTLNFTPVTNGSEEDKAFWDATPTGSLQLGTVNPAAWEQFEIGKTYYLDFTPAE